MTTSATQPPAVAGDTWNQQLVQLKGRYKHVRPAILIAANILLHNERISLDDAKAQAQLHGARITAASVKAARALLSRIDAPAPAMARAAAPTDEPGARRAPRRQRPPQAPLDAEAMIRGMVDKLQAQGNAETERLREGIRKAIATLQAAVIH